MPSSDYTPSLDRVGGLLRARTKDDDGNELGTFTPNTTPTGEEAQQSIDEAVTEISGRIGPDIPEALHEAATAIASLLSAMNIEGTYFPEQVQQGRSVYEPYERRVNAALDKPGWLVKAVKDQASGGEPGPQDDDLLPIFNFDDPIISGELMWDEATQRWILRDPPPPYADEGPVVGVWQ